MGICIFGDICICRYFLGIFGWGFVVVGVGIEG